MEKNYRLSNVCITLKKDGFFKDFSEERLSKYLENLKVCNYFVFQREFSEKKGEHWQMYLEFKTRQYIVGLKKKFKGMATYIEKTHSERKFAIEYCKKIQTRISKGFIEWGIMKKEKKIVDEEVVKKKGKVEEIKKNIAMGKYSSFYELKNYYELKGWEEKKLEDFWERMVLENKKELIINKTQQCRIVWVFGKTGSGKTVWTKKYLYWKLKAKGSDVATIAPSSLSFKNTILFDKNDEGCKILVIKEVDKEFPKYNSLISFIDREDALLVNSGRHMLNNFELIVVNSIYRPEEVFGYLGKSTASQVLRRIYDKQNGSFVLEIKENEEQLKKLKRKIDPKKFIKWYKPILTVHSEPDYSLIEGE